MLRLLKHPEPVDVENGDIVNIDIPGTPTVRDMFQVVHWNLHCRLERSQSEEKHFHHLCSGHNYNTSSPRHTLLQRPSHSLAACLGGFLV